MSQEETEINNSSDSDEIPPLPDEPVPDIIPFLNDEETNINKSISTETSVPSEFALISSFPSNLNSSNENMNSSVSEDGWKAVFDPKTQLYYFWNSKTNETTWKNPRVPEDLLDDSNQPKVPLQEEVTQRFHPYKEYVFTARFNRMTGKWQNDPNKIPENFTEDARALRQQSFYFDVEGTAAAHDGRSFRAERQQKRLTKKELANYKKQNKKKKEQRKREWLLED